MSTSILSGKENEPVPQTPTASKADLASLRDRIRQQLSTSKKKPAASGNGALKTVAATPKATRGTNSSLLLQTPVTQQRFELPPPSTRGKRSGGDDLEWSDCRASEEGRSELVENLKGPGGLKAKAWLCLIQYDWKLLSSDKDQTRRIFKRLLRVFEQGTQKVPTNENRNDESFVEMWILYARVQTKVSADDARNTFQFMKTNRIGEHDARFYVSWAKFEADTGNTDKAQQILGKGQKNRAEPASVLTEAVEMFKRGSLKTPARVTRAAASSATVQRPPRSAAKTSQRQRRDSDEVTFGSRDAKAMSGGEETVMFKTMPSDNDGEIVLGRSQGDSKKAKVVVDEDDEVVINPQWKQQIKAGSKVDDEQTVNISFKRRAAKHADDDDIVLGGSMNKKKMQSAASVDDGDIVFKQSTSAVVAEPQDAEQTVQFKVKPSDASTPGSDIIVMNTPKTGGSDGSSSGEVVIGKNDLSGDDEISIPAQENTTVSFGAFKSSKLDDDEITLLMKLQDEDDPTIILKRQVNTGKGGSKAAQHMPLAELPEKKPATVKASTSAAAPVAPSSSRVGFGASGGTAGKSLLHGKGKGKGKGKRGLRSLRSTKFGKLSGGPARRVGATEAAEQLDEEEEVVIAKPATSKTDSQRMPPPPAGLVNKRKPPTQAGRPPMAAAPKAAVSATPKYDDIEAEVNQLLAETGAAPITSSKLAKPVAAVKPPAPVAAPAPVATAPVHTSTTSSKRKSGGKGEKDDVCYVNGVPYEKLEVVGRGGTSKVYKVMGPDRKIYAVKRIRLDGADQSEIDGYINEITLLKRLANVEQIIQLKDAEVNLEDKLIFMVMPFGDIDLAKLLQREKGKGIDENFLRLYWQQMLEAVHAIHEERIIHADLKPANFLFVEGKLKLIDFGIAKAISNDTTNIRREDNEIVGTTSYMSPEAILDTSAAVPGSGKKLGRASDIWSLGCILYQMVYGHTPFSHLSVIKRLQLIPNPKHEIVFKPVSNSYLMDVMTSILRRNPEERPTIPQLLAHAFVRPQDVVAKESAAPVVSKEQLATLLTQLSNLNGTGLSKDALTEQIFAQLQSGGSITLPAAETAKPAAAAPAPAAKPVQKKQSQAVKQPRSTRKKKASVDRGSKSFEQALAEQQAKLQPVSTSTNARFVREAPQAAPTGVGHLGAVLQAQLNNKFSRAGELSGGEESENSASWTLH